MEKAEERFKVILTKFENLKIPVSEISKLKVCQKLGENENNRRKVLFGFLFFLLVFTGSRHVNLLNNSECLFDMPQDTTRLFREPEYCEICKDITKVDKVANISPTVFLKQYINTAHPVVVTDGAVDWPARKLFNFDFFRDFFNSMEINRNKDKNCQFFPYKTEFQALEDVFKMKKERAMLQPGEKSWYVGWNNCNDEAGRYLKQFYDRPYFLTNMTENIALSWIFMGGPGNGAHMHVDNVFYPSWQAQLSGKKKWKLAPPPECYYQCKAIEVTVEPGEIIVLDTNRWYHQTIVLPGVLSVTIGSEFD